MGTMWRVAAWRIAEVFVVGVGLVSAAPVAAAQAVPQPFPRPTTQPARPATPPTQKPPSPTTSSAPAPVAPPPAAPSEATLGVPVYPGAQFIASYDAGLGQRYYLFGSTASFADLVTYYRNTLRSRGELVYEEPATHMFDVGRFREESMAFPPSVTIKDYVWGGTGGYLNPARGVQPQRFPTIIQIVPAPAAR